MHITLKQYLPKTLQNRIILLAVLFIFLSTILVAYLIEKEATKLLLKEKERKLFILTHMLDIELNNYYETLPTDISRDAAIERLNQQLTPLAEKITENIPKIGVGYYHKSLDAIVVYAPATLYKDNVGRTIEDNHPGHTVMRTGQALMQEGHQVRGNIMNAMTPIIRHGEVIGYIWANELIDDIRQELKALDKNIAFVSGIGLLISIFFAVLFSKKMISDVNNINHGLISLKHDLTHTIPPLKGEMNDIVTGINQLSSALNEEKTLNELILESTVDNVITVDNAGRITMMNPAAEKTIGVNEQAMLGKYYAELFGDAAYQSPLLHTLEQGIDQVGVETDFPLVDRILQVSASTSHLRDHNQKLIGAVVIFKDLTEKNKIKQITEQTERLAAIGELISGVAHEIRNPLTAIRGFVQYLNKGASTEEISEYTGIILKEVDSINKVVKQLLDFARPPKNFFAPTLLNELIHETLILIRTNKASQNITIKLDLDPCLPLVAVDREMIKQVLLNVLINALQSIDGKGFIHIKSYYAAKLQVIDIHDSGKGIDPDSANKVFQPFYTTKPSGTGLGLAISQRIMASHKGTLTIANHEEGGVMVTIKLPTTADNERIS